MYGQTEGDAYDAKPAKNVLQSETVESDDRPVGIIEEKFNQLGHQLEHLEMQINRATRRLDDVLSPEAKDTDVTSPKDVTTQSSVAHRLDGFIHDTDRMTDKLKDLIERIEI